MGTFSSQLALVLSAQFLMIGCSDSRADAAWASAVSLVRLVDERPGANCVEGGQALQFGLDRDQSGALDSHEILHTAYVCDGQPAKLMLERAAIDVGDPRCPSGGSLISVTEDSLGVLPQPARELVLCRNAATPARSHDPLETRAAWGLYPVSRAFAEAAGSGAVDFARALGAALPLAAAEAEADATAESARDLRGPAAPVLGRFVGSQIVHGAIVTCESVATDENVSECRGLKVNGLDVRIGDGEIRTICQAVTGLDYFITNGAGVVRDPFMIWNGASWAIGSGSSAPMHNLSCNR